MHGERHVKADVAPRLRCVFVQFLKSHVPAGLLQTVLRPSTKGLWVLASGTVALSASGRKRADAVSE